MLAAGLCARESMADSWFAEAQVLTANRSVEIIAWPADTAGAPTGPWSCDSAVKGPFNVISCRSGAEARDSGALIGYLESAFRKAGRSTRGYELSAQGADEESAFDKLQWPLVAIAQKGGACDYLVLFRDTYRPLASGNVPCRDLHQALEGIDTDLYGRDGLIPIGRDAFGEKRMPTTGYTSGQDPHRLDFGLEASFGPSIPMTADKTENEGTIIESRTDEIDFSDITDAEGLPPMALKAFVTYRGGVGLRIGFQYSGYSLANDLYDDIRSDIAAQGGNLQNWEIARKDYSVELVLGKTMVYPGADFGMHGIIGVTKVDFEETVRINGKESHEGLLMDEMGILFGAGVDCLFFNHVLFGAEAGLLLRGFRIKNASSQPDGTANEIQIRIRMGLFGRKKFGIKRR